MILQVLILTASILKVVNPSTDGPLYVFRDPACKIHKGEIKVTIIDLLPPDPTERVGYLTQDGIQCDVFEVVYPGI
jgi:hypothetical protein